MSYVVQGFVVAHEGFSANEQASDVLALFVELGWVITLAVLAWRMKDQEEEYSPTEVA
jgi:hypothetical protein